MDKKVTTLSYEGVLNSPGFTGADSFCQHGINLTVLAASCFGMFCFVLVWFLFNINLKIVESSNITA